MKVSIIIVNYNTPELTLNCVKSLLKHEDAKNIEIILVDNASTDNSFEIFEKKLGKNSIVKLVKNKVNEGFTGGNNVGINKSTGEIILLLNSDTILNGPILHKAASYLETSDILSIKLVGRNGEVQNNGGYFPNIPNLITWMFFADNFPLLSKVIPPYHLKSSDIKKTRSQDWVTGAFLMLKREVVSKVGLLDDDYFMYVEEMDYCYRAKRKGFSVIYVPEISITHLGQGSATSEFALLSEWRNIKLFIKKHYSKLTLGVAKLIMFFGAMIRILIFSILDTPRAKIYVKALK